MNDNVKIQNRISLLEDKELLLTLNSRIIGRLNDRYLPKSFNDFSNDILEKLLYVDRFYKIGVISREIAIQIMSCIIEYQGWINRFKDYEQDVLLEKLKEINEILWIKRKNMFILLENGIITKEQFTKVNSEITRFEKNNFVNNIKLAIIMDNPNEIDIIYRKNSK